MNQGEIWTVDLDPTQGAEIRKTRPVIIVNDDAVGRLPLKIVVPLTDWKPTMPKHLGWSVSNRTN